jgi:hypothetical protein
VTQAERGDSRGGLPNRYSVPWKVADRPWGQASAHPQERAAGQGHAKTAERLQQASAQVTIAIDADLADQVGLWVGA